MERHKRLVNSLKQMGYDGPIPQSLTSICNPSTYLVWEQFIQNIKPKQEVEKARRKIITNRLTTKSLKKQDEFPYPIKEIELYSKKIQLERELETLKSEITEKETEVDKNVNKTLLITSDHLKQKIEEANECIFTVNKRCENLESKIQNVQEKLTLLRNLTPVESDDLTSANEITQTLQKCVEKLEKSVMNIQSKKSLKTNYNTTGKKSKKPLTFDKENIIKSSKKLFCTTTNIEHSYRETYSVFNYDQFDCVGSYIHNKNFQRIEPKMKRESLGILPESYLNVSGDDFLLGSPDCFVRTEAEELFLEQSTIQNLTQISNNPYLQTKQTHNIENLYKDEFLIKTVKSLLYNFNRHNIFKCLEGKCCETVEEITNAANQVSNSQISKANKSDMALVHSTHINIELDIISLKLSNKNLEAKVQEKKKQVLKTLLRSSANLRGKSTEVLKNLELQLEDVGLEAAVAYLKKELIKSKSKNELHLIENKLVQINTDLQNKVSNIEEYLELTSQTLKTFEVVKEQTRGTVSKLNNFTSNFEWANALLHELTTKEIDVFKKFSLEFNRRFSYTDPKTFYRNILCNTLPSYVCVDSDILYMLTILLDTPYNLPEIVLLNILKNKVRFTALKSLEPVQTNDYKTKYNLEDLRKGESYVNSAVDELNKILCSNGFSKVLQFSSMMQKTVDLWKNTQFEDFIAL